VTAHGGASEPRGGHPERRRAVRAEVEGTLAVQADAPWAKKPGRKYQSPAARRGFFAIILAAEGRLSSSHEAAKESSPRLKPWVSLSLNGQQGVNLCEIAAYDFHVFWDP
jgi:hypothetical protein